MGFEDDTECPAHLRQQPAPASRAAVISSSMVEALRRIYGDKNNPDIYINFRPEDENDYVEALKMTFEKVRWASKATYVGHANAGSMFGFGAVPHYFKPIHADNIVEAVRAAVKQYENHPY